MNDSERLEFIKERIKYFTIRLGRSNGKIQLIDDLIWLIEKAEKGIKKDGK